MRALEQVLGLDDLSQLAAQDRDLARTGHVRVRGEEPEQPHRADDRPVTIDALDGDVLHPRVPVHGREAVRLRDHEQAAAREAVAQPRVDLLERNGLLEAGAAVGAQDPEPPARGDRELVALERVFPVAEEDEVLVEQPLEEVGRVLDLVLRVGAARRPCRLDHPFRPLAHGGEVPRGPLDVAEHRANLPLDLGELALLQVAADLDVDDRFPGDRVTYVEHARDPPVRVALGSDHRVDPQPHLEVARGERVRDRLDEERGVLAVGLDDRSDGLVAVVGERGVEGPDGERLRAAAVGQLEGAEDLAEQLLGRHLRLDVGG